jgi:hypothetical protein
MTRGRSRLLLQFGAMLLLSAWSLVQISAGFASPLSSDVTVPAAISAGGCCINDSDAACAGFGAAEMADLCERHCAQSHAPAPAPFGLPAFNDYPCANSARAVKVAFPDQGSGLNAAPRAISNTPLIYHLQRLLN